MERHKSDECMTSIPIDIYIIKYLDRRDLCFVYNVHGPTLAEMTGYSRDAPTYAQGHRHTMQNERESLEDEECTAWLTEDVTWHNRDMPWLRLFIRKILENTLKELLWLHKDGFVLGGELILQQSTLTRSSLAVIS